MAQNELHQTDFFDGESESPPTEKSLQELYTEWITTRYGTHIRDTIYIRARDLQRKGWKRYGIARIVEALRWEQDTTWGPNPDRDGYKINNNWRAFLARDIMAEHPELKDFFTTREQNGTEETS